MISYDRPKGVRGGERRVVVEDHLGNDGEAVPVRIERRQIRRQSLGEHGEDPSGGVDRRRIGSRVFVDRGALLDKRIDIRDRDENLDGAAPQLLRDGQLIQVSRIVVVDRAPKEMGQIPDLGPGLAGSGGDRSQLLLAGPRELRLEPVVDHRLLRDLAESRAMGGALSIHAGNIRDAHGRRLLPRRLEGERVSRKLPRVALLATRTRFEETRASAA